MVKNGIKARMMTDARALLEQIDGFVVEPVIITISSGGNTNITLSCSLAELPEVIKIGLRHNRLLAIDKAILAVAGRDPLTAKRLAHLSNYKMNSHFSAALTRLVRRSLLEHTADGYRLPGAK